MYFDICKSKAQKHFRSYRDKQNYRYSKTNTTETFKFPADS